MQANFASSHAQLTQWIECQLPKLRVAGSTPVLSVSNIMAVFFSNLSGFLIHTSFRDTRSNLRCDLFRFKWRRRMRAYPREAYLHQNHPHVRNVANGEPFERDSTHPWSEGAYFCKLFLSMSISRPRASGNTSFTDLFSVLARVTSLCDQTDASVLLRGCATKYGTCEPRV